ncbi:hypothetical protein [Pyruvatibacter sp.]|uniref:hypothetical protein n=1 Tax=Pyruvatibacter sp. TaxID=1981328 RepID=UPI00326481CC
MKFIKYLMCALCGLVWSNPAYADQCLSLVKLSKIVSSSLVSEAEFTSDVKGFCESYSRNQSGTATNGIDLGYDDFSFGGKSASSHANSLARSLCKSSDTREIKENVYQSYIEKIAPGAFEAYQTCATHSARDFSVSIGESTSTFVPIAVRFSPGRQRGTYASISLEASPDVTCNNNEDTIEENGTLLFSCSRPDDSRRSTISVVNTASSEANSTWSIPWTAYRNGVPVNLVSEYTEAIAEARSLKHSLANAVIPFKTAVCPDGFTPYRPAYGRFIRGLDLEGQTDPNRIIGTLQDDQFKKHHHKLEDTGQAEHSKSGYDRRQRVGHGNTDKPAAVKTTIVGGDETRPKNVALLYCEME